MRSFVCRKRARRAGFSDLPVSPSRPAVRRLVLIALFAAAPALAQTPADSAAVVGPTTAEPAAEDPEANEPDAGDPGGINDGIQADESAIRFRPRLAPSALYDNNRGVGLGGGVAVDNVGWRGSVATADLIVQRRFLGAAVSAATSAPDAAPVYGRVSAAVGTTDRRFFFGTGPFTAGNRPLYLQHTDLDLEAEVGVYPLGNTALRVVPGVRYLYDRTGQVQEGSPARLGNLTPASVAAVDPVLGTTRTGVSLGAEVSTDLRDWPSYPKRGTLVALEARRFVGLDAQELRFTRVSAQSISYLPLDGRTAIIANLVGVTTRQNDADGDGTPDAIPYFYLPTLDDRIQLPYRQERLTGRDLFAVGVGLRVPVRDFIGLYGVDAVAIGYLGNAYDNVFEQFSPAVSFRPNPTADEAGRAPLRPALGLGIGVVNLEKERVVLGALVGIGAGGFTVATLRAAYNLRDARPLFR